MKIDSVRRSMKIGSVVLGDQYNQQGEINVDGQVTFN